MILRITYFVSCDNGIVVLLRENPLLVVVMDCEEFIEETM